MLEGRFAPFPAFNSMRWRLAIRSRASWEETSCLNTTFLYSMTLSTDCLSSKDRNPNQQWEEGKHSQSQGSRILCRVANRQNSDNRTTLVCSFSGSDKAWRIGAP